jgi:hypothetical protein
MLGQVVSTKWTAFRNPTHLEVKDAVAVSNTSQSWYSDGGWLVEFRDNTSVWLDLV